MPDNKVFLIDGHALCYRSFYAIQSLSNSKGQPTNAVYGFINALRKIFREYAPSHMAVCFDVGKKTRRQEKFPDYKIQRLSMPEGLISQLPLIKEVIKAYGIAIFELEGYEADDLIATLAGKLKNQGLEVVIASEDKDMYQLVGEGVRMYSSRLDKILDLKESEERLGVKPELISDYIGLCGDNADNIPGVDGIGEVTARNLINAYGTLENVYKNIETIKQAKLREKLVTHKEMAFLSKDLAVLECDVPIDLEPDTLKIQKADEKGLLRLFNEFEFRKFAQELSLETTPAVTSTIHVLDNADSFEKLTSLVNKNGFVALLAEKEKGSEKLAQLWISAGTEVFVLGVDRAADLKLIFENKAVQKNLYDHKELRKLLALSSVTIEGKIFDALLAGYLLSSGQAAFDIGALAWQYLKKSAGDDDYAAKASLLNELSAPMQDDMKDKGIDALYSDMELPLSTVLADMESVGVALDTDELSKLSKICDSKIQEISATLFKMAGMEFNLNSPKQLSEVLFVKLKLPVVKKTKTGFSTDEEVLSKLAPKHEIAQFILDYRQIAKLKSTYIDAFPKLINPKTNRLHATFNQTGAETGRLSSNNPNLQNIPIRTELGREIRRAFVALNKEDMLLSADYSQIELRILAHLAQDENLIKAFKEGQDIHTYTSGLIFDVPENQVDASMRNAAKRVNFGIIYGMSAFGLAKDLGVPQPEAQDFIDRYFLRYPRVKAFMDASIAKAQELGYVTTILNRRRYIPEIHSKNMGLRQFAERQAINTPVQGSAADLMKLAMINIHRKIQKDGLKSKMIITVHDELVFNVPLDEIKVMTELVRYQMEHVWEFLVPITVSVKVGKNWLQMEKV